MNFFDGIFQKYKREYRAGCDNIFRELCIGKIGNKICHKGLNFCPIKGVVRVWTEGRRELKKDGEKSSKGRIRKKKFVERKRER